MKTTRALLFATATLLLAATVAAALLKLSLPVAELFEYATGTFVTTGLLTIHLGTASRTARPLERPRTSRPVSNPCRTSSARCELAHAL